MDVLQLIIPFALTIITGGMGLYGKVKLSQQDDKIVELNADLRMLRNENDGLRERLSQLEAENGQLKEQIETINTARLKELQAVLGQRRKF